MPLENQFFITHLFQLINAAVTSMGLHYRHLIRDLNAHQMGYFPYLLHKIQVNTHLVS